MKNVAATSGHRVSFAAFFLVVESAWEGSWAGTDMLLNLYSRPPKRCSPSAMRWGANSRFQNTRSAQACNKKMHRDEIFSWSGKAGGLEPPFGCGSLCYTPAVYRHLCSGDFVCLASFG